jgi:hypothetical protein
MGKGNNDEEQVDISQDMKSKVQPSQDNRDPMVNKLEKGATVVGVLDRQPTKGSTRGR